MNVMPYTIHVMIYGLTYGKCYINRCIYDKCYDNLANV